MSRARPVALRPDGRGRQAAGPSAGPVPAPPPARTPARTAILHVGMSKAGSTAIQNALDRHRDRLLRDGILFPKTGFTRTDPKDRTRSAGHVALLRMLKAGDTGDFDREWAGSGAACLVLSAENILHDLGDAMLAPLAERLAGMRIVIVAILRGQDSWLQSRYFESVVKGIRLETRGIDPFAYALLASGRLDYGARLDRLAALFNPAEIRAIDYDVASAAPGGLLGAFLSAADLPLRLTEAETARRYNVSAIAPDAVEAMRRLNHLASGLSPTGRLLWSARMRGRFSRAIARGSLARGPVLPDRRLRARILADSREANRRLSQRYLGGAPFGPTEAWRDAPEMQLDPKRVAMLFDAGLCVLHEIPSADEAAPSISPWGPSELAAVRAAFRPGTVMLLDDHAEALAIAAAQDSALVFQGCGSRDAAMQRQLPYDRAPGPAHVIVFAGPPQALWDSRHVRHPDLVFLGAAAPDDVLRCIAARIERPVRVVIDRSGADHAAAPGPAAPLQAAERHGRLLVGTLLPAPAPGQAGYGSI